VYDATPSLAATGESRVIGTVRVAPGETLVRSGTEI